MKAVIIARVSTEEQKDAGNSLPAQITRLESYCERKGYQITKKFSFDESAYKNQREEFDRILDYIIGQKEKIAVCFDKVEDYHEMFLICGLLPSTKKHSNTRLSYISPQTGRL